jgi:hypothetical protein
VTREPSSDPSGETRVLSVYSLSPRIHASATGILSDVLQLGFLQRFVNESADLFPGVLLVVEVEPAEFPTGFADRLTRLRLTVLLTPRGDPVLLMEANLRNGATAAEVTGYLRYMHYDRDAIALRDRPLMDWLAGRPEIPHPVRIVYAHQMVFAAGALAEQVLAEAPEFSAGAAATILQGFPSTGSGHAGQVGVRVPGPLNVPGRALVANSRYVTIVVGWGFLVQDSLVLVSANVIAAFGVLRRARTLAFRALMRDLDTPITTIAEARERHAQLAAELNEIQLDLSFGVEAYADNVLIPDSRMDSFRASYHEVVGLTAGLANTSRIMERLSVVIQARSSVLAEASRERQERRDRLVSAMLSAGSLLAIPLTLLLAFFGVSSRDVDPGSSMFDISRYWLVYLLAWLPFSLLLLVGVVLRRRIQVSPPRIYGGDDPLP